MSTADSGQYNCVAGNVLGETSASYDLQINSSDRSYSNITQISFFLINLLWRMIELTLWRRYLHSLKYCWSQNAFTFHADIHLVSRYSSLNYCDNTMSKEGKSLLIFFTLNKHSLICRGPIKRLCLHIKFKNTWNCPQI